MSQPSTSTQAKRIETFILFGVCVATMLLAAPAAAIDVGMQALAASCRGKGTITLHSDGLYYCNLSKAGIARNNAELRSRLAKSAAECRAAARDGAFNSNEPYRKACEDVAKLANQNRPDARKQKMDAPKLADRQQPDPSAPKISVTSAPAAVTPDPVSVASPADFGTRIALVIGNSEYRNVAALPNPGRDAAMIAQTLRHIGFQTVTLQTDLPRDKLIDSLKMFASEAEKADWALIYFAGHGVEMGGVNYLIPIDAKLATDRDVQYEAIGLDQALSAVEGAKKLRLVVLDACRDNPFLQGMRRSVAARSIGRGLGAVEPDSGTLVAYAAKDHQIALDGDGQNSPFASAFAKYIEKPGIEVRRLFDFVRDDVLAATHHRQQPFTYGSLPASQDFFFVATPGANAGSESVENQKDTPH